MSLSAGLMIAALALVSALIAYLGDLLGRHVGKRRIKIFGQRPRVSAIIITSITGGLISLLSVAVLYAVSADFRTMVARVSEYNAQLADLERQRQVAQAVVTESELLVTTTKAELTTAQDKLREAQDNLKTSQQQSATILSELETLQAQLATLDTQVAGQQEQATRLKADIAQKLRRLSQQNAEIDANTELITNQESVIASLRTTVTALREGDVLIAEGARLAGEYLAHSADSATLEAQLLALQGQVALPKEVRLVWPSATERAAAIGRIQAEQSGSGLALTTLVAAENGFVGQSMKVRIVVAPFKVVYPTGALILSRKLPASLTREQAALLVNTELLPAMKRAAIAAGSIPKWDGFLGGFDSLTINNLIEDLLSAPPGATLELRAIQAIKPLELLVANTNFSWELVTD